MGTLRMGTLISLIPLLGIPAGLIIAYFSPKEHKQDRHYYLWLQRILLGTIVGATAWHYDPWLSVIGVLPLFFTAPLWIIPLLGIPSALATESHIPIFLYFLPTATLHKKEWRQLLLMAALYTAITIVSQNFF